MSSCGAATQKLPAPSCERASTQDTERGRVDELHLGQIDHERAGCEAIGLGEGDAELLGVVEVELPREGDDDRRRSATRCRGRAVRAAAKPESSPMTAD